MNKTILKSHEDQLGIPVCIGDKVAYSEKHSRICTGILKEIIEIEYSSYTRIEFKIINQRNSIITKPHTDVIGIQSVLDNNAEFLI